METPFRRTTFIGGISYRTQLLKRLIDKSSQARYNSRATAAAKNAPNALFGSSRKDPLSSQVLGALGETHPGQFSPAEKQCTVRRERDAVLPESPP